MKLLLTLAGLTLLFSCATIDVPPGGDVDQTPPRIVSSSPDSAQTLFAGDQIKITFDEYFTTNNLSNNLLISPPFSKAIKSKTKGKTLIIYLPENLKANTTYQFYFGNAISDLNEGNKTKNLRLFFSTGTTIDSGTLHGEVLDAFTQEPIPDCKVFLYKEFADSQLVKQTPYYISLTDKSGHYHFQNIANDKYQLYALKDDNNNNALDIEEACAFLNQPVPSDSSTPKLLLSKQTKNIPLRLSSSKEVKPGIFQFVFSKPLSFEKTELNASISPDFSKTKSLPVYFGQTRDTLYSYFIKKTNVVADTISFHLNHASSTFLAKLPYMYKEASPSNLSVITPTIHPNNVLSLKSTYLIRKTNRIQWELFNLTDSIPVTIDSISIVPLPEVIVFASFQPGKKYCLITPQESYAFITDQYNTIDTLYFNTLSKELTGSAEFNIEFDSTLLQTDGQLQFVIKKKGSDEIYDQILLKGDTVITFNFLLPGTYEVYVFEDGDGNNSWSSGNYYKSTSPERIWRLNSPIEVREKWENKNISFKIN